VPIRVSSASFFSYLVAQSTTRVAKVKAAKRTMAAPHNDYKRIDYWLQLRMAIVSYCLDGDRAILDKCIDNIRDPKKVENYKANVDGIKRWSGRKALKGREIKSKLWVSNELEVSVTP
jgi:hypothetical protein